MILSAIVWAGGHEVPEDGINSPRPTAERMLSVMAEKGKVMDPNWTAEALQPLLDQLNRPGEKVDWRRPTLQ